MDDLDQAAEFTDMHLRHAMQKHFDSVEPSDGDGICIDCGEPILEERLRVAPGCRRCVGCQDIHERIPHD